MAVAVVQHATRSRPSRRNTEVSGARHNGNRHRTAHVAELRCECARPTCRATIPVVAEAHRGSDDCLVVVPAHFSGDGVVIRAADAFFVVRASLS